MATRYATPTTNKRPTVKDRSAVAEKRAADLAQRDEDDLRAWQMVRAGASYREVATAMHELGHLLNNRDDDPRYVKEKMAWEWALENMLPGMAINRAIVRHAEESLHSYENPVF